MDFDFRYITESNELTDVIDAIGNAHRIGLDTETTALKPKDGKLLTIQVATPDATYVCNATKIDLTSLYHVLLAYDGLTIIQNGKFDLQFLFDQFGLWWQGNFYDPYIAQRLKNTGIAETYKDKFVGLDRLALGYLGLEVNKNIRNSFQFSDGELTDDQIKYAAEDAALLLPLHEAMQEKVLDRQPQSILDLEFGVLPVTAMMEYYGMGVDAEFWGQLADEKFEKRADHAEKAKELFSEYIDWDINLNSWQQLLKAFNEYMGLNIKNTQAKTLQRHRYKLPELFDNLLAYKTMQKFTSTYGREWLRHVNEDGSVYASFHQLGTDTGRYSCSDPPLQTIPIRKDNRYREAFVARPGYKLITADYNQVEFRMAGEFSDETSIVEEYLKSKPDFHQLTADRTTEVLDEEIERDIGKKLNFELIYGAGSSKLAEELGCDMATAKQLHAAFWGGYPDLRRYMYQTGYRAITDGYAITKLGRRRYFNIAQSTPSWMIDKMQREGGNHPIQGSAADLLKRATLTMFPRLIEHDSRLVHQVHDELVAEAPEESALEVANIIQAEMINAGEGILEIVPVEVDCNIGDSWSK